MIILFYFAASDETTKAFHPHSSAGGVSGSGGGKGRSGGVGGTTTFDESRDADDEASSGKTCSSESDEFMRKITIMANGTIHSSILHCWQLFKKVILVKCNLVD